MGADSNVTSTARGQPGVATANADHPVHQYLHPADLLEGFVTQPSDRRWWVLYTKSRQEKAVAERLAAHQSPHYLPLVRKTSLSRGREIHSHVPVFAGYLFLYGSVEERLLALQTNRLSQVLEVPKSEQLCNDLRQLAQLIASDAPLTVESRIKAGQPVRVKGGPLAGLEGVVIRRRNQQRLLVAVNYLQQGASVEIKDYLLEAR